MNECLWCGRELPWRQDGRETRKYCSNSHRQLAYIQRKKEIMKGDNVREMEV